MSYMELHDFMRQQGWERHAGCWEKTGVAIHFSDHFIRSVATETDRRSLARSLSIIERART